MEIVFQVPAVIWLILLVILLVIEAVTLGLTTIWFAGGALAAFILALLRVGILIQIAAFCVISVVLLLFTRPVAVKWLNRSRTKTNAESLIGQSALVTEPIDNLAGTGQVQIAGQVWTARAEDDAAAIDRDKKVTVIEISGVKLIVKEEK